MQNFAPPAAVAATTTAQYVYPRSTIEPISRSSAPQEISSGAPNQMLVISTANQDVGSSSADEERLRKRASSVPTAGVVIARARPRATRLDVIPASPPSQNEPPLPMAGVRNLRQLRAAGKRLYREDRATGHVRVLAEMMAAGLMDPALGRQVAARVDPWVAFLEETLDRVLPGSVLLRRRLPVREIAYGLAAMFLGMEMLGTLSSDHDRADAVVDRLSRVEVAAAGDEA